MVIMDLFVYYLLFKFADDDLKKRFLLCG